MQEAKQEYLQRVLETHRMHHIDSLVIKYRKKRDEVKESIEENYKSDIYSPVNSGSFAKSTAINIKFDLDILVPVKKKSFSKLEDMFDDLYNFLSKKYEGHANIRKQKVSIGLEFFPDDNGDIISIDVVPGRELNEGQYSDDYKINLYVNLSYGEIKEKSYLLTNIKAQVDHIKSKESERKIIRLLKIWKSTNKQPYKSFFLELMVIKAFEQNNITGNLWEKLKGVLSYIENNIDKENFRLIDPGNSGNNVADTLGSFEKSSLASTAKNIVDSIESNSDFIKIYFPLNSEYENSNSNKGYGLKESAPAISIPTNTRFG